MNKLTVIQVLPALNTGGVERGTLEIAAELVRHGHRSIVISGGGELLDELVASGSEHITLPVGKKSPLTLLLIPELRRIIAGSGASILHARSRLPAWICWFAWKGMDVKTRPRLVTSVHGPYTVNSYSKIMTRGERVIAVSDFIRSYIMDNYPDTPKDRIVVIPRGVSPDRYPYRFHPDQSWQDRWHEQYPALNDKQLITMPGRLTRWKGQQDFLQVLANLPACENRIHGLIVGGPHPRKQSYADELVLLAEKLGVQDRVTFTGHRHDLKEIMSISTIVMSLSTEPEAFGRTVLEALCLGTPVIGYDHGGTGEILRQVFPAGMIERHDPVAAARLIELFLLRSPAVPQYNPFTLQRMLDSTLQLYDQLANETSGRTGR